MRGILVWTLLVVSFAQHLYAFQPRSLSVDDVLRLEEVREVSLSPDGEWIAYVLKRSKATATFHGSPNLANNDHADIWVARATDGLPQNVTNGAADQAGYWAPKWSPDGMRLAMLSTKGGNVRVWLWTRASGQLEMLSEHGVDPIVGPDASWDPFVWISRQELLVKFLPTGQHPLAMTALTRIADFTAREWAKAWRGQEAAVSALESGTTAAIDERSQRQLAVIDVDRKAQRLIATGASFGQTVLAPGGERIAFLTQVDLWRPDPDFPVTRIEPFIYQVRIAQFQGDLQTHELHGAREVLQGSLLWSPDGQELAFIGVPSDPAVPQTATPAVFRCSVVKTTCRAISSQAQDFDYFKQNRTGRALTWVGHELLVFVGPTGRSTQGSGRPETRMGWLHIDAEGRLQPFGEAPQQSRPNQLLPEETETAIGLADGALWRFTSDGQRSDNLTSGFKPRITAVVWPETQSSDPKVKNTLVFRAAGASTDALYVLDIPSREVTPLPKPAPDATLVAFNSEKRRGVFRSDVAGTYLWVDSGQNRLRSLVQANTFLREREMGAPRPLEYRGLDGQPLKGWVILPAAYKEGTRLPTVVWVYPGTLYSDAPPRQYPFGQQDVLNPQLLAARGYAVLLPSMPLKPFGQTEDPYLQLTKGVLPAVDKLVDLAIADQKRIGLIGWSYGGFGVYGLVTQTNRFQAAIAGAGYADLVSLYGTFSSFDGRSRYDRYAHEDPFRMWNVEMQAMGGPPWKNLGRYLRNSPINYADRVDTPLMIVHGDLDAVVGIEQAEEFFTALYRQNKRAKFVRYWGEGHGMVSPANIRDMWTRIYAWFEEYLGKPDNPR